MTPIEFTIGGVVTTGQGSMDIFAFYRKDAQAIEMAVHEAVRDPQSGLKEPGGLLEVSPSSSAANQRKWTKRRMNFPAGSYVKFLFRRQRRASMGSVWDGAGLSAIILSPRESAALMELRIALPTDSKTTLSAVYITGRFDILTMKEIRDKKLNKSASGGDESQLYDFEALEEFLQLRVLEKAARPKAVIKTKTMEVAGAKRNLARVHRPRRIVVPDTN